MIERYRKLSIITKAALWAFVANVFQRGVNILVTPIFTRILTTEEYAQYNLYQSWHDIFIIFVALNVFNYATYTAMVKFENDKEGFIVSAQTIVSGLTMCCFILYYIVHCIYGDILEFPLPVIGLMFLDILFFSTFNLWATKQRYDFKYRLMTILSILMGLLGPIFGIIAIHYANNRGYGRIYGVALVNIIFGFIIYIYNIIKSRNMFDKRYYKFIFIYCIPLIPHFLSTRILISFDRIMINSMCSASAAGIYSLAYSLSILMSIVNDAVLKSFTPWTYQSIKNGNADAIKKTANIMLLLVAGANILLILFAPEAIKIFAPEEYHQAVYIIPAVSASVFFMFLFNMFANIEYYYSETKYVALASVMSALVNIILNYIFIKRYGYIAAGYTTLISYILYAVGHYVFMRKVSKKHADGYQFYDMKNIIIVSILFVSIAMLILPLYKFWVLRYIIITLGCIIMILKRKQIKLLLYNLK